MHPPKLRRRAERMTSPRPGIVSSLLRCEKVRRTVGLPVAINPVDGGGRYNGRYAQGIVLTAVRCVRQVRGGLSMCATAGRDNYVARLRRQHRVEFGYDLAPEADK